MVDQKIKKLQVTWLGKCPKCERTVHTVSTEQGNKDYLYEEDLVECWCGLKGKIDTDGMGSAWCDWEEKPDSNLDLFNKHYRKEFPDFWSKLPNCNHQAYTHYSHHVNEWFSGSFKFDQELNKP